MKMKNIVVFILSLAFANTVLANCKKSFLAMGEQVRLHGDRIRIEEEGWGVLFTEELFNNYGIWNTYYVLNNQFHLNGLSLNQQQRKKASQFKILSIGKARTSVSSLSQQVIHTIYQVIDSGQKKRVIQINTLSKPAPGYEYTLNHEYEIDEFFCQN